MPRISVSVTLCGAPPVRCRRVRTRCWRRRSAEAVLREFDHLAVVGRHVAGRAEQVRLAQAPPRHLGRVVGESEVGPDEVERARAARHDLARRHRVDVVLDDQAREDGLHARRVGPFHHASGTTSSTRSSCSCHVLLEAGHALRHVALAALVAAADHRRVAAVACPCTICERWSARHRPKVTNQVCSRPGWYGSLMFSCISFQLPGMRWRE